MFQFKMNMTKNLSNFRFISSNPINFIEAVNSIITNTTEKLITTKVQVSSVNIKHFFSQVFLITIAKARAASA